LCAEKKDVVAASVLFAPPLTLLGMVSPYAIKLKTVNLNEVGRSAGNLYAVSTVASVFAALLTGFFLIPNVGVSRLTLVLAVVLLLASTPGWIRKPLFHLRAWAMLIVLLLGMATLWLAPSTSANPERGLIAVEQSPYAEIRVLDEQNRRYLLIDGGVHSIVKPSSWESDFAYVTVVDLAKSFFEKPGKLLLIGLGGGSIVKNFARDGWQVDAVEIDPAVASIAREHFGLAAAEGNIFRMDGRQFLTTHQTRYDLIILDAFGSSSIPFHLATQESFALAASHLNPGGVFAMNVETLGWEHPLVRSLAATLRQSFSQVLALPTYEPFDGLGNVILFAAKRELELRQEIPRNYEDPRFKLTAAYQQGHAWDNRFTPDIRGVPILTDDLNPVDLWTEAINLVARRQLHGYFGASGLSW